MRAPELGLLATVGCVTNILVNKEVPKIRVGVLSSGNELVSASTLQLSPGKIRDSNKCMLMALAEQLGEVEAIDLGEMQDSGDAVHEVVSKAIEETKCDVIVTSGGVSMGELDLVKPYIEHQGEVYFGRLNMKPGKPTTLGRIKDCFMLALPGNPVSCFVTASLFLGPLVGMLATGQRKDNHVVEA